MERVSSGVAGLDSVLGGGLLPGDNVVWFGGSDALHTALQRGLIGAAPAGVDLVHVTTRETPKAVTGRLGAGVRVVDARPGARFADPLRLEDAVVERGRAGAWVVVDHLDDLVRRYGPDRALGLFSRVCPQLFDAGTMCYWRAGAGSRSIRDGIRGVTQCVLDVSDERLRIDKAEGRHAVQGRIFRIALTADGVEVGAERAIGRLAEGLRRLRSTRHLSQSEVARIAGVSPSAISQAEAGHRGLGLDTVLAIAEGAGVGLEELLALGSNPGYVIARRDRTPARRGVTPLLDDPTGGIRAYLVVLGPGESGAPPTTHKGSEVVVVGDGLVQLDLGDETPVMRAGDAVLVTGVAVVAWRNLLGRPARFFWILRDPLPRDA